MKIVSSQVNKPENVVSKAIERAGKNTVQAIEVLQTALDGYRPGFTDISEALKSVQEAVNRLEQVDNSIDPNVITDPISQQVTELRDTVKEYTHAVEAIEVKPNIKLSVPPPDLHKINESFKDLDKRINELFRELDLMERPELVDYFKKILDLLDKINKKTWNFIGGGGANILQGYEINSGNLVNITAVESADTPGVYGVLALNADGSAIGSGGGVVETFKRITSTGDIRVTSTGDIRVHST